MIFTALIVLFILSGLGVMLSIEHHAELEELRKQVEKLKKEVKSHEHRTSNEIPGSTNPQN